MTAPPAAQPTIVNLRDPAWQALILLRVVITVAMLVTGIDKFFNLLTYWPMYLAPVVDNIAPLGGQPFMYIVGAVEIMLGLMVLIVPRYGAPAVAGWLGFIIVNLLLIDSFYDIALRDFGLFVAAIALFRLTSHRMPSPAATEQEQPHA